MKVKELMELGNPQLGKAPEDWESKEVELYYQPGNIPVIYTLHRCDDCGGFFVLQCPCWFRSGGRYNNPDYLKKHLKEIEKPSIWNRILKLFIKDERRPV